MDLIDRKDAINAIYHHFTNMAMGVAANVLYEVQSVAVMPDIDDSTRGKWEEDYAVERFYVCPDCGCMSELPTAYCASCGKQMRGEKHE